MAERKPAAKSKEGRQGIGRSFANAYNGFVAAVRTQRNMRVHVLIACFVLAAGLLLGLDSVELAIVVLTIMVVFATELLNSALEFVVDLVTEEFHPLAKLAKDISAAAVFVSSVGAVVVGLLVVADELGELWSGRLDPVDPRSGALALVALGLAVLVPALLKALLPSSGALAGIGPSGYAAVAFAAWVAASILAAETSVRDAALVSILVLIPSLLVCQVRVESGARTLREVTSGAVLGATITLAVFVLT